MVGCDVIISQECLQLPGTPELSLSHPGRQAGQAGCSQEERGGDDDVCSYQHREKSRRSGIHQSEPLCIGGVGTSLICVCTELERLKPIEVDQFAEHVRQMHQDRDKGFEEEYQVSLWPPTLCGYSVSLCIVLLSPSALSRWLPMMPLRTTRTRTDLLTSIPVSH